MKQGADLSPLFDFGFFRGRTRTAGELALSPFSLEEKGSCEGWPAGPKAPPVARGGPQGWGWVKGACFVLPP
jgi:hypothetical protein